jgi:hypothetical protein
MVDSSDKQAVTDGFSLGCSALIAIGKIWATGVSLGTGIVAGQFWGPLFTGCAAAHFFTALVDWTQSHLGFGGWLAAHPCIAILCIMGSSHVVTFRTHSAITLILTLTISSFNSGGDMKDVVAGDYSAIFPLLVVAVYVSFILARDFVFYKAQRARGDILALPEVLCEPGKVGRPLVVQHVDDFDDYYPAKHGMNGFHRTFENDSILTMQRETSNEMKGETLTSSSTRSGSDSFDLVVESSSQEVFATVTDSPVPFRASHRRSVSVPSVQTDESTAPSFASSGGFVKKPLVSPKPSPGGKNLVRVVTYGEVTDHQPSLLDQARARSATVDFEEMKNHRRYPSANEISDKMPLIPKLPSPGGKNPVQVSTYGEGTNRQPLLVDQGRARSSTVDLAEMTHPLRNSPTSSTETKKLSL